MGKTLLDVERNQLRYSGELPNPDLENQKECASSAHPARKSLGRTFIGSKYFISGIVVMATFAIILPYRDILDTSSNNSESVDDICRDRRRLTRGDRDYEEQPKGSVGIWENDEQGELIDFHGKKLGRCITRNTAHCGETIVLGVLSGGITVPFSLAFWA